MNKTVIRVGFPRFLMVCRLLIDKGIREYIQAAQLVKARYPQALFRLAGPFDPNPSAMSHDELDHWEKKGIIDYLGFMEDIRPAFKDCSVYVLPSYREGTPRSVLEAMSMGRPIITTNAPGCRETIQLTDDQPLENDFTDIIQGENGFLVPVRNVDKLVLAMQQFIEHPELIQRMGHRSREIAVAKYDVHKVNAVILRGMGLI